MIIKVDAEPLLAVLGESGERWVQRRLDDGHGGQCLHGAIRRCQTIPGDAFLIQQVAARRGWGTSWNDAEGTTWDDVRARLAHVEVTDADLADTFGPQWPEVVALVRRAAAMTASEAEALHAVWDATRPADWGAANAAAWDAAVATPWDAARDAATAASVATPWDDARAAAADAARMLVVRDLIGQHGFTKQHYDLLTNPWRTVIGPVHPLDDAVAAGQPARRG